MSPKADCLRPPLGDGSGYLVRDRDLRFLGIDDDAVARWRARSSPLGLSETQYRGLREHLAEALRRDGVVTERCDVRLKGSAADFFSGLHKVMPRSADEVIDLFRDLRKRIPEPWEVEEIEHRRNVQWITDGDYPMRRPFDSMHRLNIDREPSDIDLQISSDQIVERCVDAVRGLCQEPISARINHPTYNFVKKDLIERLLPNVYLGSLRLADAFGRGVTVAVFPSNGPRDVSETHGDLSSHFRVEDWVVPILPTPADDDVAEA